MPENTLMKRASFPTLSVLAHEYGSHTHAGTDTHARHKDALSCLLCNIQTRGDLARTSWGDEWSKRRSAVRKRG
jgi:hypothetical protein